MRQGWLAVLLMLALTVAAGCDSDDGGAADTANGGADVVTGDVAADDDTAGGDVGPDAAPEPQPVADFVTFNAGLAYGYVLYAEERQPEIGPAIAALEGVDVVCLQEVWAPEDVQAVLTATAAEFPHSHWYDTTLLPNEGAEPACNAAEAGALRTCAEANDCENAPGGLVACVQANCGAEMTALQPECLQCLVANIGGTLDQMFEACAQGSTLYLYDGANGLLLLSRLPLTGQDQLLLDSTFNRRAVLYARATGGGDVPLAIFCTHTTPEFDGVDYPGELGSWADEQAHQIDQMTAWIDEKAEEGDLVVLMGDMNDGPALPPDIEGELEDNFAKFLDAGFSAPYAASQDAACTFCDANPLNPADTRNVLIDHVFVKGGPANPSFSAMRLLDEDVVTVTGDDGPLEVPLSDHYGVRVEVLRPAE